jgi:hypothetical protein
MKRILSFIIGITFIFANSKEGDIGFRYGFLSKPSYDSDSLIVLSDSSIIHTGDFLKINIGYKNKTNFCIAYRDAEGGYSPLYSSDDEKDSNQDTLYISALHWAKMKKPTGLETFYFINSNESLSDLNTMLGRYEKAPPKGKSKLAVRIQDKINSYDPDMQDDLSSISSVLDKPIAGGVAFRGEDDGLKDISLTHECFGSGGSAFQEVVLIHK